MKRLILLIPVAITALVAILVVPGIASADNPHHNMFTLVAKDAEATLTPSDFFDTLAPNAQATEDAPVYRGTDKVGLAETIITVTRVAGDDIAAMIECSIELPEGNLLFNGTAHFADLATGAAVPVVGGTGAYAGARGVVVMIAAEDGSATTLNFDITTK